MSPEKTHPSTAAVIGGGPAGLMAAEVLVEGGVAVDLYDAMPSVGRKFLIAGKGGLNLTHSEPGEAFLARYGPRRPQLEPFLAAFGPDQVRQWLRELGFDSFVGSSGRVFPTIMQAGPILYAWRERCKAAGVTFHMRHRWLGWDEDESLRLATPQGEISARAGALVLALGGGSWPQLGSTGAWIPLLEARDVAVSPFKPANCGFDVGWSEHFRTRFAGQPVKAVELSFVASSGAAFRQRGEFVITEHGVEGSLIYATSALLRDEIEVAGRAVIQLDLAPDWPRQRLLERLSRPRGSRSLASYLQRAAGIQGVKAGLLREFTAKEDLADPGRLAAAIKALPLPLLSPRPLAEALSSAGGVPFEALDPALMLRSLPGVFCAGEMLDWEAPTGGYLLSACFATGRAAGLGALAWLRSSAAA